MAGSESSTSLSCDRTGRGRGLSIARKRHVERSGFTFFKILPILSTPPQMVVKDRDGLMST